MEINKKKFELSFSECYMAFIILMAFIGITFTFIEPFITKKYVNEEFKILTNKNPSESEYFGETKSDGLMELLYKPANS